MRELGIGCKRLYVYECRGPELPKNEPSWDGFMGIWPEPPFYYIFFDRKSDRSILSWIGGQSGWSLRDRYEIDYDQWQQVAPSELQVGPFLIRRQGCPETISTDAKGIMIKLNPGVVFGSGLHATTMGCLLTIANVFEQFHPGSVVDLGTGTGILAIACALLGASKVLALDCNLMAVKVAEKNIEANRMKGVVECIVANGLEVVGDPLDLLVMNIEWPCLKRELGKTHWLDYGIVVMSGLLETQYAELETFLHPDLHILSRIVSDDWLTLAVSKHKR